MSRKAPWVRIPPSPLLIPVEKSAAAQHESRLEAERVSTRNQFPSFVLHVKIIPSKEGILRLLNHQQHARRHQRSGGQHGQHEKDRPVDDHVAALLVAAGKSKGGWQDQGADNPI